MLKDNFGRIHNYLRISLTDNCNFRCTYCMPQEEMEWMPQSRLMSADEIVELAEVFVELGVTKIRLTGGEPLVRKDAGDIIQRLSKLPVELSLTTNGILVPKYIDLLKESGVKSINVSLDTLSPEKFKRLTRRDQFQQVWNSIMLLLEEGFRVKINAVAMLGQIEDELVDFIQLTKKYPLHIRFIEFMPFQGNSWDSKKVLTAGEMLKIAGSKLDFKKLTDKPHSTAKKYKVSGYAGTFAFITTMSEHFCGSCNRLRLTADGKIKNCLFGKDELDLLSRLRNGEEVRSLIHESLAKKHAILGGQFSADYQLTQADKIENRSMIKIGG